MLFLNKEISTRKKVILAFSLVTCIMFCYYQPLFFVFSLLKSADSYFFRYSYVVIFTFIFIAANYYESIKSEQNKNIILSAVIYSFLILLLNYVKMLYSNKAVYYTCFFIIITSILIYYYFKNINKQKVMKKIITILTLFLVVILEMSYNTHLLMKIYSQDNVSKYEQYQDEQQKQIDAIKSYDNGIYRISQTTTRGMTKDNLTANYNESLAFNYMSITSYTSTTNTNQLRILQKLGYNTMGGIMKVTNTSVLGTDSLLGVKYILSPYDIKGTIKRYDIEQVDGKYVYENPYALSLAFICNNANFENNINDLNPFEYQNYLYSNLIGRNIEIYKKADYTEKITEDNKNITYNINIPKGNYSLYANFPWNSYADEIVNLNGKLITGYAKWLSPSVLYVPFDGNTAFIEICSEKQVNIKDTQIYLLDLDILKEVTFELNQRKIENISINKNQIRLEAYGAEGQRVFTTIPYINGMEIIRNNEKINPEIFDNCFITIPLNYGENNIEINYTIPGIYTGILITIVGITIILLSIVIFKKKV